MRERENVGSWARSFSSRVVRVRRSSSSSEEGAAVFCVCRIVSVLCVE